MSAERGPLPTENTLEHFPELGDNQYVICEYQEYLGEGDRKLEAIKSLEEMAKWLTAEQVYGRIIINRLYVTEFDFDNE